MEASTLKVRRVDREMSEVGVSRGTVELKLVHFPYLYNQDSMSALHWAVKSGDTATAQLLIDSGTSLTVTDKVGTFI